MSEAPPPAGGNRFAPDFLQELFANPLDAGYQDAADRRARTGAPSPVARGGGFVLRMIAVVAIGLLLTVAYRQAVQSRGSTHSAQSDLASQIMNAQTEADQEQKQADALSAQVAALRDAQIGSDASTALGQQEEAAGVVAVTGPGLTVTMADGPTENDPVTGQPASFQQGQVYDIDLRQVTNELWHDGAEAISINNQRLTLTTAISAAGSAILANYALLTQPYRVSAIGGSAMIDAWRSSAVEHYYHDLATQYGMRFDTDTHKSLKLPAGPVVTPEYASVPGRSPAPSAPASETPSAPPSRAPAASASPSPGGH